MLGAAAAPTLNVGRLVATLAAFFLAVGISAHALDELNGRPLHTRLSRGTLIALAAVGLAGAVGIGIAGAIVVSPLLIALVLIGGALVPAYNLELVGGRFHTDLWFALAWGGFPAFTGYFAQTLSIAPAGVLVAAACCLLSAAQRRLSTPVRELRRRTTAVTGEQLLDDGSTVELTKATPRRPARGGPFHAVAGRGAARRRRAAGQALASRLSGAVERARQRAADRPCSPTG